MPRTGAPPPVPPTTAIFKCCNCSEDAAEAADSRARQPVEGPSHRPGNTLQTV